MHLIRRLRAAYGPAEAGPTRREMLRLTLAGTAGLLLSRAVPASAGAAGPRVLIVGAGFAGLAAAHELHAVGYDVHVFEARNRLGGRVLSFHDLLEGHTVEGGAELIGSNHPTWVAYRARFKLKFLDVTEQPGQSPVVIDGRRLGRKEGEALWNELDRVCARLNDEARPIDAVQPWTSARAVEIDRQRESAWIDAQPMSAPCRKLLHAQFMANNGVDTAAQSHLANLAQIKGGGVERYWTDTEVFRCAGGNQLLAMKLAATLPADRVHLRTAVKAITTSDRGGAVTLGDGSRVEGDDVILAVPPSVWRSIAIDPPLPAVLTPQMGKNVKFLAVMKSKFWRASGLTPDMLGDAPVQLTWEATDNQPGPGAVLTAFSGGSSAEVCRGWKPAERANRYLRTLEVAYRDIAPNFVKARFMDWPGDAWTRGSYSFAAPGEVTTLGPMLRAGFGHLHFAGEHTNYAFVGYMEGALGSGVALARKLAERDGVVKVTGHRPQATVNA